MLCDPIPMRRSSSAGAIKTLRLGNMWRKDNAEHDAEQVATGRLSPPARAAVRNLDIPSPPRGCYGDASHRRLPVTIFIVAPALYPTGGLR